MLVIVQAIFAYKFSQCTGLNTSVTESIPPSALTNGLTPATDDVVVPCCSDTGLISLVSITHALVSPTPETSGIPFSSLLKDPTLVNTSNTIRSPSVLDPINNLLYISSSKSYWSTPTTHVSTIPSFNEMIKVTLQNKVCLTTCANGRFSILGRPSPFLQNQKCPY